MTTLKRECVCGPYSFAPMAIVLQIEVSQTGMRSAKDEIAAFLAHESTRSEEAANLAWVVLRKMLNQIEQVEKQQDKAMKDAEAKKPKPSIREMRRAA